MLKTILGTALALTATLASQTAHASSACTYTNLYQEMQQADPSSYAKIKAQADATANGEGIFLARKPRRRRSRVLDLWHHAQVGPTHHHIGAEC